VICNPCPSGHSHRHPDFLFRAGTGVVVVAAALAMTGCGSATQSAVTAATPATTSAGPTGAQAAGTTSTSRPSDVSSTGGAAASNSAAGAISADTSRQSGLSAVAAKSTAKKAPAKTAATKAPAKTAAPATALAALAKLPVKGRAPKTGYSRAQFGQSWADVNRNGCDTRNDILARDLTSRTVKPGTHGCIIASGVLNDPYTARYIHFTRGNGTSTAVQIDHVVALSDAWQTGAQKLSASQRRHLANDPLELLAVDGPTNEKKGDGDAATWLPANKSFRCQYVARQVAVKVRYKLWVTPAEHDAIARVLSGCKSQKLPGAGAPVVVWKASGSAKAAVAKKTAVKAPAKKTTAKKAVAKKAAARTPAKKKTVAKKAVAKKTTAKKKVPAKSTAKKSAVYYKNCAAAKKAGAAPLYRGHPGYRSALDRDNDGIACEWH